ncbi:MAG: UDP-N-acetylmuramoyl-L-alanine--D-glutamate ligase [Polyangiaceae bacterium]|nr:UDP-N-acetylmuramoyl-L-alanine--D-glutamate ligase [Polyangiaceae bacterium]
MELHGKQVVVVGLGKSGTAAARLCLAHGANVVGTDSSTEASISPEAKVLGIPLCLGGHDAVDFAGADLVVVSPGVPNFERLIAAEQAGVEVIGELELAARFVAAPILLVGGTNGKSTTVTLLGDLLKAAGKHIFLGGNLGTPAAEAAGLAWDYVVYEISSFQAERVPKLKPKVSVLLNITDDHLDRYQGFKEYASAKGNVFVNQGPEDVAIIPSGDPECAAQANRGHGRQISFGEDGQYRVRGRAVFEVSTKERFELSGSKLFGRPNLLNASAAIAAARAVGVPRAAIEQGLLDFVPLAHRMAFVREVAGVRYYDDSKATNVGAAVTALTGIEEERAVLIAGGRDKLGSYAPLADALEAKGRALVVMGEAKQAIMDAVGNRVPVYQAGSMNEAVELAAHVAQTGDAVLMSPACSSFDMFKSYAHRGDCFQEAVRALSERKSL